jgi:hypothetical protein
MRREGGDALICESPDGNAVAIPWWMADAATCNAFLSGPPLASMAALEALRSLLEALHARSKYDEPSGKISLEVPDVRHAVEVSIEGHVIIDVDAGA